MGARVEVRERKAHEVSTTVRIQGLLADVTTEPLPHEPEDATRNGQKRQGSGLPSDAGTEYPPISSLTRAPMQPPGPGPQAPPEPLPPPRQPSPSRLAATVQGIRVPPPPPPPASSVPMRALVVSGGMLITMVIGSFFVGRCSVKPTGGHREVHAVLTNELREIREAMPAPPKPCWVAKQPVRWAPVVSKNIPFELLPMPSGNVAIGYAKSADEAVGVEVTPQSGQVNEVFSDKPSRGEIERVSPTGADKQFFISTTEPAGALKSIVQVPAAAPFFVGLAEGNIAAADTADGTPSALWPLGGEALDAARVVSAGDRGYALTFRRDNAIYGGWIGADRKPSGELVKVVGSGGSVGKPIGGFNGREIAIIFADREAESSPYKMRFGHAPAGTIPASTEVFEMPAGGPGGDAFAPGITGLADGRWLLIWTEGSAGSRAIRVQTLGPDFAPVGDPIALSPPAGNFGQGVLSVSGAYVTAVFLQKGKSSFELWGGVLQCG
jgi:hypothetical protein